MHKKLHTKLISLLLLLLLLISTAACETPITPELDSTAPASADTQPQPFSITGDYILIRPETETPEEIDAMRFIKRGLDSIYGTTLSLKTDWVNRGAEVEPAEYEILIGSTNREHSQAAKATLPHLDYCYEIISENVILIYGGSPKGTLKAAQAFMLDLFGYEESEDFSVVISAGQSSELSVGTSYFFRYDYPVDTLTIEGYPIEDFTIVSPRGETAASQIVINAISDLCGYNLPVIMPDDYIGSADKPAIFIGCANPLGEHLDKPFDINTYYITSSTAENTLHIIIDATSSTALTGAAQRFVLEYIRWNELAPTLQIPIDDKLISGIALGTDLNYLYLASSSESEVAPGITYSNQLYYDLDQLPVRAYVLTVKSGSGVFYTGTPEDGETLLNKGGTVLAEMKATANNGKNAIAGINADFYNISGNFLPRGLCIKEGVLLHNANSRPWFGVTDDGTPVIGSDSDYEKYSGKLRNAVGGSNILLVGGKVKDVGIGTEFGYTRHPRTAVGFRPDGTVVLLVVDGRQKSISNGASLADLADIFINLGCTDAINLDGGGSSTFILNTSGSYSTENSPSDGRLRKIQNSLLVLLP